MDLWTEMKTGPKPPDQIFVVVEIPKGSMNKYEYNKEFGLIVLDRVLYSPFAYPGDYGFIPQTLGEDNDPLDCLVLMEHGAFPTCVIPARPVAVLRVEDENGQDDKILCVPTGDPRYAEIQDLKDLPSHIPNLIAHFFQEYKRLEKKKFVKLIGWFDSQEAKKIIKDGIKKFNDNRR